jgi:hypothetical protein
LAGAVRASVSISPYTHPDPAVRHQRFEDGCHYVAQRMLMGAVVYSPIAHSHPICERFNLPVDWNFWQHFRPQHDPTRRWSRGADARRVAPLSWRHSGINVARGLGLPIEFREFVVKAPARQHRCAAAVVSQFEFGSPPPENERAAG